MLRVCQSLIKRNNNLVIGYSEQIAGLILGGTFTIITFNNSGDDIEQADL